MSETTLTRDQLEVAARDVISRFLGNPTGQAHDIARGFSDEELQAIVALDGHVQSVGDRPAAVTALKDVFTNSYERKRKEHEAEAVADQKRLQLRTAAARVLIANGRPDRLAREDVAVLSEGEQKIVAALEGETDVDDVLAAVMKRALARTSVDLRGDTPQFTATLSVEAGNVEPGWAREATSNYAADSTPLNAPGVDVDEANDLAAAEEDAERDSVVQPVAELPPAAAEPVAEPAAAEPAALPPVEASKPAAKPTAKKK